MRALTHLDVAVKEALPALIEAIKDTDLKMSAADALSYTIGFGLEQQQRSAMALGMCTRNIAALFAAFFGIANPPDGLFVMIVLAVPLAVIVALVAARLFARQVPAD